MTPAPRSGPTPLPALHQLMLPFDDAAPPSAPLLLPVAEARRMGVRPRTVWRTLSMSQRAHARRTLVRMAAGLLRAEGPADDQ
jgi:hypothetical protein